MGGLGNQMFQYALGTHLAIKNSTVLKLDFSLLADKSQPHEVVTHRNLEIDIFDIPLQCATQKEVEYFNGKKYSSLTGKAWNKVTWQFHKKNLIIEHGRKFHPEVLLLSDNKCLVGSWQREKYFKDIENEIRKLYSFNKPLTGKFLEIDREIQNSNSVCIHVRRGDYVTSPLYSKSLGAVDTEYYHKALEILQRKQQIDGLFVFSDDLDWCKNNLTFPVPTHFMDYEVKEKKYAVDMQLMNLCKHFIIPNSTFGWWAAWLSKSPGKIVIAPKQWYKDPASDSSDLVPAEWIRL